MSYCGSDSDDDSDSNSDDETAAPTTGEIRISVHILPEVRDSSEEIEIPVEAINLIEYEGETDPEDHEEAGVEVQLRRITIECCQFEVADCFDGPFDLRAMYATTTRSKKLGQKPEGPETIDLNPVVRLSLRHTAIDRSDPEERWKLGSDRLMVGVYDQELVGGEKAVGVGIVHLSQVEDHWGKYAWLNLYGLEDDGSGDSVIAKGVELLGKAWANVSEKQRKLLENRDMVSQGCLPGTAYTGRIKVRLEWKDAEEFSLFDSIPCCSSDGASNGPGASAAGGSGEQDGNNQVGFRFRSLVLQAGSLPKQGVYTVELSCGKERVKSVRLRSDGSCVNWWASCGSGQGVELDPLEYRRLSIHDITQVPDVFVNLFCGTQRVGFTRLNPEDLASGEELSFEIAEWYTMSRDPEGPVEQGGDAGSVLLAVSIEPIFPQYRQGDKINPVESAMSAGRAHRKRKPTAPRRRTTLSPSRTQNRRDTDNEPDDELTNEKVSERSVIEDRRSAVKLEQAVRDKKRTLRMIEGSASTQLDVTVVQAQRVKDPLMFGSAAGQYLAEVTIATPGASDRIRRKTQPCGSPGADPIWDQALRFDVPNASSARLTARVLSKGSGKEDRPICSTADIDLKKVLRDRQVEGWFPLSGTEPGTESGQLFLSVSAHGAPEDQAAATDLVDSHRIKLRELEDELAVTQSRLRASGHLQAAPSRHNWSIGAGGAAAPQLTRFMLDLHIYQARNLPPVDANGAAHTCVRATIGNQSEDTTTRKSTLFPRWYETVHFELELPESKELMRVWAPQLVLSLLHMPDSMMATPELLGRLHLELDPAAATNGQPTEPKWETCTMHHMESEERRPVSPDLLISYELSSVDRLMPGRAKRAKRKEKVVELEYEEHTVSLLVLGCRGLQPDSMTTPVPEISLAIPSVDPDEGNQCLVTLEPKGLGVHTDPCNPTYCHCERHAGGGCTCTESGIVLLEARLPARLFAPTLVASVSGTSLGRIVTLGTATINLADFMAGGSKTAQGRRDRKAQREINRKLAMSARLMSRNNAKIKMSAATIQSGQSFSASRQGKVAKLESYRASDDDDLEYGTLSRDSTVGLMDEGTGRRGRTSDSTSESSDDGDVDSDTEGAEAAHGAHEKVEPPRWDWLQNRKVLRTGLETWLPETPVISFPLYRKAAKRQDGGGVDPALQAACGVLKAAVVVTAPHDLAPDKLLASGFQKLKASYYQEPEKVTVFMYVVRAIHLPSDGSGDCACDARLRVKLQGQFEGHEILPSDSSQPLSSGPQVVAVDGQPASSTDNTLNPYFGQLYKVETTLPGSSRLSIELFDHKDMKEKITQGRLAGEEIGTTVLDLEERYFSNRWSEYCAKQANRDKSNALAPIETRTLRRAGTTLPRGQLELWVDIFPSADVDSGKRGQLDLAQYRAFRREPEAFELRVAIMNARKMHHMEGDLNDLKISAEVFTRKGDATLRGSERKSTDTHHNTTAGSFNQWISFTDVKLYHPVPTIPAQQRQPQRLLLKAWDADTFTADDLIGSYDSSVVSAARGSDAVFDVDKLFGRAIFEVSKVKPAVKSGGARKFSKHHVFRLPDSKALAKEAKKERGESAADRAKKKCCSCFRSRLKNSGPEPTFVPLSKQLGAPSRGALMGGIGGGSTGRGEVQMHIELLPKQLADSGQQDPAAMEAPVRPSLNPFSNPFGALSMILPFSLTGDLLPCSIPTCLCSVVLVFFVLVFFIGFVQELPKVVVDNWMSGE